MKLVSSLLVKKVTLSLVLGVALCSLGCTPSSSGGSGPKAAPPDMTAKPPELPKDVPASTAESIKASQASGRAMAEKAQKEGSAMGRASDGWR